MNNISVEKRPGEWKKEKEDRGLFVRGKNWYVRYTDQQGKLHTESTRSSSRANAVKVLRKRQTEVAELRFFPEQVRRNVTFDVLVKDTITRARERYEMKYPGRKFRAGRYDIVSAWFEGRLAASITPQEIAAKLAEHCKAPATHNRYRVALSHVYKIGMDNRKVVENPARLVKLQTENNERVRFLEPEEEQALRKVIREQWPEREPEFDLALQTGMRWAEQYNLRWEHVDLKRKLLTIPQAKSGRRETIPINSEALKALTKLRSFAPVNSNDPNATLKLHVCPDPDEWHHRLWWTPAREVAKITDFCWHDLRHTFASRLVMNGVDILTVNKLLRHKTLQVTMRYAHLAATHLHDAVERLASVTKSVTVPGEAAAPTLQRIQ